MITSLLKTSPRYAGLLLMAAGILLLVLRFVYSLAARTSLAAKEYKSLMESGLISDLYEENRDKTLINTIKETGSAKEQPPAQENPMSLTEGSKEPLSEARSFQRPGRKPSAEGESEEPQSLKDQGASAMDAYATAPLGTFGSRAVKPAAADGYMTVPLGSAKRKGEKQ